MSTTERQEGEIGSLGEKESLHLLMKVVACVKCCSRRRCIVVYHARESCLREGVCCASKREARKDAHIVALQFTQSMERRDEDPVSRTNRPLNKPMQQSLLSSTIHKTTAATPHPPFCTCFQESLGCAPKTATDSPSLPLPLTRKYAENVGHEANQLPVCLWTWVQKACASSWSDASIVPPPPCPRWNTHFALGVVY